MAILNPRHAVMAQGLDYSHVTLGTVADLSAQLYLELQGGGYSLLQVDIQQAILLEVQYYSGWAVLEVQKKAAAIPVMIDQNLTIDAYEWSIIEPVVRAHCDLLQARLVEGSRSLGGDGFGIQVSEAQQNYTMERDKLPRLAFVAPPYTLGKSIA